MTKEYRERLLKHYETIGNKSSYDELKQIIEGKSLKIIKEDGKKST